MLCYFYYISPLLFQKWGMVKAGHLYLEWEFGFRRQSSSGSLPIHITSTIRLSPLICDNSDMMAPTTIRHLASLIYPIFKLDFWGSEDSRNHGEIDTVTCKKNEYFIRWVATQHQMVDLNKNFIRSLFYHFLVLLLILSMFNHFIKV